VNYTNGGSFIYSLTGTQATLSGSNVSITQPGNYTVTAFNALNNFSISTLYTGITISTSAPQTGVSPISQTIVCGSPAITFTGTSNMPNVTHAWTSPYSTGSAYDTGSFSFYSPIAVGIFTHCATNNSNGCSTCTTFTIASSSAYSTFQFTSPSEFTLGCGTSSVTSISILGAATVPPRGVISYTVLPIGSGSSLPGPPQAFTTTIPGTYMVIVKDLNNTCETKIPVSIIQETSTPQVSVYLPTLSCYQPNALLTASSNVVASFAWINGPITLPGAAIPVNLNTNPASSIAIVYTLVSTGAVNNCKSTNIYVVYQDQFKPNAIIAGAVPLTCITFSLNLTNNSNLGGITPWPLSLPKIASAWYGSAPQASLANSSSYPAYTPGTYTMIALNLNNGCTAPATVTVADNRIFPMVSAPPPFTINCPNNTANIFGLVTGASGGITYSWTGSSIITPANTATLTVNAPGIYTLAVSSQGNCTSQAFIQVAVCANIDAGLMAHNAFVLFPNPVSDKLVLGFKILPENISLEIWSASGVLVRTTEIRGENTTVSLQNEQNGLYLVRLLESGKTVKAAKILKN
jgi:hypothetical protein